MTPTTHIVNVGLDGFALCLRLINRTESEITVRNTLALTIQQAIDRNVCQLCLRSLLTHSVAGKKENDLS